MHAAIVTNAKHTQITRHFKRIHDHNIAQLKRLQSRHNPNSGQVERTHAYHLDRYCVWCSMLKIRVWQSTFCAELCKNLAPRESGVWVPPQVLGEITTALLLVAR